MEWLFSRLEFLTIPGRGDVVEIEWRRFDSTRCVVRLTRAEAQDWATTLKASAAQAGGAFAAWVATLSEDDLNDPTMAARYRGEMARQLFDADHQN